MRAKLDRIAAARGVNYWPTYARSPIDQWTAECRRDAVSRELGFVAGLGLNSVRLWNSAWGYEKNPGTYLDNLRFALDRCDELGLGVDVVLFDSCGIDPEIGEATERSIEEAMALMPPDQQALFRVWDDPGMDILEAPALVQVPDRGAGIVAIWEGWVPNPGYYHLGPENWPRWDSYTRAVVESIRDHPALMLLEVMNEPFVTHIGSNTVDFKPIRDFYSHVYSLLRELVPGTPLTIGAENLERFHDYEADLDSPLDAISLHPLTYSESEFKQRLEEARILSEESRRPAIASEWGAFPGGHDEAQLAVYEAELPIALESGVGWMISHLIAGYLPFALTAILYANGTMRPAAKYIRRTLAQ